MSGHPLWDLTLVFVPFSLTAFGGGLAVVAGMQHQAVDVHGWMSESQFLSYFAISRAAPGPGSMLATLLGWQVAGLGGAIVASAAMFLPSSILCAGVAFLWQRFRGHRWLVVFEQSVAPIGVGLLIASLLSLANIVASTGSLVTIGVGAGIAAALRPALHPALMLAVGAAANATFYQFLS